MFIDPLNLQDSEGMQVGDCLFDSLLSLDYATGRLLPAAAESWYASDDATVWTFELLEGATFHDGTPVRAQDFVYAWNRICNPAEGSGISYLLSSVQGYFDMQDGAATELSGLWAVDDLTLVVTLYYPSGDFEYVVAHPALAPVPWAHDRSIDLVRYDRYYGAPAHLDGVEFKILSDDEAAWQAFQAGNLDFSAVPAGELAAAKVQYGASDDGITVIPIVTYRHGQVGSDRVRDLVVYSSQGLLSLGKA